MNDISGWPSCMSRLQPRAALRAALQTRHIMVTIHGHQEDARRRRTTTAAIPVPAIPSATSTATPTATVSQPFSATSSSTQAASTSAAVAATQVSLYNSSERVAVWTSCRPLRRLPTLLDDPTALLAAARWLPGYGDGQECLGEAGVGKLALDVGQG